MEEKFFRINEINDYLYQNMSNMISSTNPHSNNNSNNSNEKLVTSNHHYLEATTPTPTTITAASTPTPPPLPRIRNYEPINNQHRDKDLLLWSSNSKSSSIILDEETTSSSSSNNDSQNLLISNTLPPPYVTKSSTEHRRVVRQLPNSYIVANNHQSQTLSKTATTATTTFPRKPRRVGGQSTLLRKKSINSSAVNSQNLYCFVNTSYAVSSSPHLDHAAVSQSTLNRHVSSNQVKKKEKIIFFRITINLFVFKGNFKVIRVEYNSKRAFKASKRTSSSSAATTAAASHTASNTSPTWFWLTSAHLNARSSYPHRFRTSHQLPTKSTRAVQCSA